VIKKERHYRNIKFNEAYSRSVNSNGQENFNSVPYTEEDNVNCNTSKFP